MYIISSFIPDSTNGVRIMGNVASVAIRTMGYARTRRAANTPPETIAECYSSGTSEILVQVHITANHMGYFEFRLCPHNDPSTAVQQSCLDQHVLKISGTNGAVRYNLPAGNLIFNITVELPDDVTCTQCVLQWKYNVGK